MTNGMRTQWTWEQVISDTGVSNVRLTLANEAWLVSPSLPRQFVIPGHVTDAMLSSIAVTCAGTGSLSPPLPVEAPVLGGCTDSINWWRRTIARMPRVLDC